MYILLHLYVTAWAFKVNEISGFILHVHGVLVHMHVYAYRYFWVGIFLRIGLFQLFKGTNHQEHLVINVFIKHFEGKNFTDLWNS